MSVIDSILLYAFVTATANVRYDCVRTTIESKRSIPAESIILKRRVDIMVAFMRRQKSTEKMIDSRFCKYSDLKR